MKVTVHTFTCEAPSCGKVETCEPEQLDAATMAPRGWRRLKVELLGDPYPLFEGDVCDTCAGLYRLMFKRPVIAPGLRVIE